MRTPLLVLTATVLFVAGARAAEDTGQPVTMPEMMQVHMRANMRDHLLAVSEIQSALAAGQYDPAPDIAEQRLGMT